MIGDFEQTLHDCEVLLGDKHRFQRSPTGFVRNVVWHTSTQRDVEKLRQRVHFHMIKIGFIAKPFETHLLSTILRELLNLRRDVAELKDLITRNDDSDGRRPANGEERDGYPSISEELIERFTAALYTGSPPSYHNDADLPLKEGFDTLVYHLTSSTVNVKPELGRGHDVLEDTHYLNLLKSKWIKEKLHRSEHFRVVGRESLWWRYMKKIEDEIADQVIRFEKGELVAPRLEALNRLPDQCFVIWITEAQIQPPAQADQRPYEEKILETAINGPHETLETTLTVFAEGDFNFRLVSTTKNKQNEKFHVEKEVGVNMNRTRLVPMFAVSQDYPTNHDNYKVYLYGNDGQGPQHFVFRQSKDVADFQRALTNYCVSYETSKVSWRVEFENFAKSSLSGEARLQLWYLKPLPEINRPGDNTLTGPSNMSFAGKFQPPGVSLRRFWTSGTYKIPSGSIISPVKGSSVDGIALIPPELPALLLYTKCDDIYGILYLKCKHTCLFTLLY